MAPTPDEPRGPRFDEVAGVFMDHLEFVRIGMKNPLMIKKNRTYVEEGAKLVHRFISHALPTKSQSFRNEVVKHIGDCNIMERDDFDANPDIMNCKNHFVDIWTGEIQDDNYLSMMQIDTDYQPDLGRSTLDETGVAEAIPEYAEVFLEFISCILLRHSLKIGKMLINVGDGRRGKSTYVMAARNVFGTEKFSDVELVYCRS